jgi:transposase-like protein
MGKRINTDEVLELERRRWPDGVECAYCGSENVTRLNGVSHTDGLHACNSCRQQFTVTTNTLLHRTRVPIETWMEMARIINEEGGNALQASKELGITYKTAWRMMHIVRTEPLLRDAE